MPFALVVAVKNTNGAVAETIHLPDKKSFFGLTFGFCAIVLRVGDIIVVEHDSLG